MYTDEENQMIQTYMSFKFLLELHNVGFVKTKEYSDLPFKDSFVHEQMKSMGIMNQGMIPPIMYMMLVMPRELLSNQSSNEYKEINSFISSLNLKTTSSYQSDGIEINYIRHMRNAISHMNVTYDKTGAIFKDTNKKQEQFSMNVDYQNLGVIVEKLSEVYAKYIEDIKRKQKKN